MLERGARARADLDLVAVRESPSRCRSATGMPRARRERDVLGRDHVQPGRMLGAVGGERQAFAVRQALQPDRRSCSASAIRCGEAAGDLGLATSRSQSSTPSAVMKWMRLASPPITSPETSLARIQSAPLRVALGRGVRRRRRRSRRRSRPAGAGRLRLGGETGEDVGVRLPVERGRPVGLLELLGRAGSTRQSATAATSTAASAGRRALDRLVHLARGLDIDPVDARRASRARPGRRPASPARRAPRSASAMAKPCLPDERLAITRTGSIGSWVGPAVTMTCLPASGPAAAERGLDRREDRLGLGQAARAIFAARHLAFVGLDDVTPSARSRATLRRVASCCHIRTFIAGAASTFLSVASSRVVARSSAIPAAIFASRSAVAGQTTTRSASRD